jgi:hypothetical protein
MNCPTTEQLAALALDALDVAGLEPHVAACPRCQAELERLRALHQSLATAHADVTTRHTATRAALLDRLPQIESAPAVSPHWKQLAFGGLGLSTAIAALLLLAVFLNSAAPLSAMERILRAVREVRSYSFHETSQTTFTPIGGKPQPYHRGTYFVCWRAPDAAKKQWLGDLHAEVKGWRVEQPSDSDAKPDDASEKLTLHLVETYPSGQPGIIIIYTEGYYFWVPPVPAGDLPADNTIAKLRAVQQGQGQSVRELGTKEIAGIKARGYILDFGDAVAFRGNNSIEAWVDPQTDLPLELSFERISEEKEGRYVDVHRLTDIRWNLDFPPEQFATATPRGLIDTTPPSDQKSIAAIAAALKLYADLSGGHYPQIRTTDPGSRRDPESKNGVPDRFDAKQIRSDMLKFVGLAGPYRSDWSENAKYQQIEAATPAVKSLARILLDHHHAGFFGAELTPHDTDKVLLWWSAGSEDTGKSPKVMGLYRVFFGDLRSETVTDEQFSKLVPRPPN